MKIKDILKQRGIKVPEKRNEFNSSNDIFRAPNKGWNDCLDAFQHILDVEVGDELSLEDIQKLVDKNAQPFYEKGPFGETHTIKFDEFCKALHNKIRQPSQTLRPIDEDKYHLPWKLEKSGHKDFDYAIFAKDGGSVCFISNWSDDKEIGEFIVNLSKNSQSPLRLPSVEDIMSQIDSTHMVLNESHHIIPELARTIACNILSEIERINKDI